MTSESKVEHKILQCIDEGLQVLGESSKDAIYYHLEYNYKLKRKEIPRKPETFCKGLKAMFGEDGANVIRKWIIEKLKGTFHLKHHSVTTFAKAVNEIKNEADESSQSSLSKHFT